MMIGPGKSHFGVEYLQWLKPTHAQAYFAETMLCSSPTLFSVFQTSVLTVLTGRLPCGVQLNDRMEGRQFSFFRLRWKTKTAPTSLVEQRHNVDAVVCVLSVNSRQLSVCSLKHTWPWISLNRSVRLRTSPSKLGHLLCPSTISVNGKLTENVDTVLWRLSLKQGKHWRRDSTPTEQRQCRHRSPKKRVFENRDIRSNTKDGGSGRPYIVVWSGNLDNGWGWPPLMGETEPPRTEKNENTVDDSERMIKIETKDRKRVSYKERKGEERRD